MDKYGKLYAPAITITIIFLISILSFIIRIFSVIKYESVIHEFDPWFNYRASQYLVEEGTYKYWNWFDTASWYPLGRLIGATNYPGMIYTSYIFHWFFNTFIIQMDIRNICVFIPPLFSSFTSISSYFLAKEVTGRKDTGLLSAFLISIVPGYISRSVAGSYDLEAVSIFALVTTFYFYIKSMNNVLDLIKLRVLFSVLCCFLSHIFTWFHLGVDTFS